MDCTGTTVKTEPSPATRKARACRAALFEGILEDRVGRLWLSTKKGISRFDPQTETFRNYDVSDGLQSNEFSDGCYQRPGWGDVLWRQQWV